jgi:hypothetical protein
MISNDATEMTESYKADVLRLLEDILNDQIAAAQHALKELPELRAKDVGYIPGAVKRNLKWAEPSRASRDNLEQTLESLVFWYGVLRAREQE